MGSVKSVLIIGGSGFLGTLLAQKLREGYKVYATYYRNPIEVPGVTLLPLNVDLVEKQKRVIQMASPDVVIYAAGSNDIEWAGMNPQESEDVHVQGALGVLKIASSYQPRFIYLSNCYAFDGVKGNYHETDFSNANIQLGKAKGAAEGLIKARAMNYHIVRSSPLFGRGNGIRPTFLDRLRFGLASGQRIEVDGNDLHSVAIASGLVDLIAGLVETGIRNRVFHYSGLTKITLYDFARKFATQFGFDPNLLEKKKYEHEHTHDYSLNCTDTVQTMKFKPLPIEDAIDRLERELVPKTKA